MVGPAPARRAASPVLLLRALFGAALAAGALLGAACASPDGITPACDQNVTDQGTVPSENGCQQFAVCAEAPNNPAVCCEAFNDSPSEFQTCLYGYGVVGAAPPGTGGGGGSGSGGTGGSGGG